MNNDFKHPIGTKVWWVGMDFDRHCDCKWKICEREVTAVRMTQCFNDKEPFRQIFLSGLSSYEGENWFDDEFQIAKEYDGSEWFCSGYMCDTIFNTKEEAEKYLQFEIDYERKENENEQGNSEGNSL